MLDSLIKAIQAGVSPELVKGENGIEYSTKKEVYLLPEPETCPLVVSSLTSLIDYVQEDPDGIHPVIIHVESPIFVKVMSALTGSCQRHTYLSAACYCKHNWLNQFLPIEEFLIALQTKFEPTSDRDLILRMLGNLSDGTVRTIKDDGFTQQVTVKSGVSMVHNEALPPVVFSALSELEEIFTLLA